MAEMTDLSMVRQAIKGDVKAFESIVYQYEKKVFHIAFQMFGNEHDAYDASQEIFLKIYQKINTFKFDANFGTWLHRLAVNTCIDAYRKKKRMQQHQYPLDQPIMTQDDQVYREIEDKSLSPEALVMQKETVSEVRQALNALKEEQKAIIILRDIEGFSYQEIAEVMEMSLGTVKSRIARSRQALKEIIIEKRELNSG